MMARSDEIDLHGEKETLLITLYSRALESRRKTPILSDRTAEALVNRIHYDFNRLRVPAKTRVMMAIRAKTLDDWAVNFVAAHPTGIVLNLGCGLDSRIERVDPPGTLRWYDVDYPEVIEIRGRLSPHRPGYQMLGSAVTDRHWLAEVPGAGRVLVLAEGLLMYLQEREVMDLLGRLTEHFHSGELGFDVFSRFAARLASRHRSLRATGATLAWGVDDPCELVRWNPRLEFVEQVTFTNSPELDKLPLGFRSTFKMGGSIKSVREAHRLLRYQF